MPETGHPLVITQNDKAAGVLLSPAEFDELSERARFVVAVNEGLADAEAARVHSHAAVVAEFKKRRRARAAR
jgi:PHD/YefM family antitoxin component YafN of YafNO toxin-antitoxin module